MRTECGGCGGDRLATFLDLGKTPLANRFPASADEPETFYPLGLCRCHSCGLVQQSEMVPDEAIYGEDYGFYSGASEAQLAYHAAAAATLKDLLRERIERGGRPFVVEVGCNDGSLLRHFMAEWVVLGIDPAAPADAAAKAGLPVLREPFTADLARTTRDGYGPAGLVIANNVLAHVADLPDVLTGIWELTAPDGLAVVEVQYLPDLLVGNMIDQVYHEHRYHWSLTAFRRAAGLRHLHVVDAQLIDAQGGSLRVYLSPRMPVGNPPARVERMLAAERWLDDPGAFIGVQGRMDRVRDRLVAAVVREARTGRTVVGYAAAAKATTILNYAGLGREQLPAVLDTTPYKQGRYVPGVKIPIWAPDVVGEPNVTRLLLASNYLGWLLRHDRGFLDVGGRWLVPIPTATLI